MAVANGFDLRPYKVATDLSAAANQYKLVKLTAASTVGLAGAATDAVIGVLYNRPKSPEGAAVAIEGRVLVQAGAAVAVGDRLTSNASGQAITASTGNRTIGVAVTSNANAGEIIEMEMQPGVTA